MKHMKALIGIMLVIVLAVIGVGCNKQQGGLDKIKLAEVTHSVFYAPQYVAIEKGFFKDEGIEIELLGAQGADKTMAALLSGEVQIGLMGPEASIYVYNQGSKDYSVCFAQLTKRDGSFIVGREPNENFTLKDLAGKEILGGRKGGVPEMTLEYAIKNSGLTIGTDTANGEVNVRTDIQFAVMAGSFTGGEGDYVTLFEPLATSLEKEQQGYIMTSVGEETGEIPYTAYSALSSYMEKNPDVIERFTKAIYEGQQFVQTHSAEEIAQIIAPHFTELSLEDLTTVVARYQAIDAWCDNPILKEESLSKLMDVMELAGELDQRAPYDKIVTTKYAESVMK
ncbi:ABC transporter substrate-binding protein [Niameybacter massiliensis]|uniref:ABC transporter substrate-binding protein n=1 Tax=Holtiella tumoricola TaxID=3018743 RepID=A0AA42DKD7_9FIRM|nr:ABC transporter substrate-binding protein [Holtiella tumoricola]MDA3730467.1 ABC transporter substrate-binding protein [Holtiella tumoricola]